MYLTVIEINVEETNVSTILHVESNRLVCVSGGPIMPLFIILLSLTISLTCFERGLTLWTRIVIVSSKMILLFNVENKSFSFRHSYSRYAFNFYCRFFKFPYTIKIIISFYPTECSVYLTCTKWSLFLQIKINNTLF